MTVDQGQLMHPDLGKVRDFPLDDFDLIVGGYPKSGPNWMQVIVQTLWEDWGTIAVTPGETRLKLYGVPSGAGSG